MVFPSFAQFKSLKNIISAPLDKRKSTAIKETAKQAALVGGTAAVIANPAAAARAGAAFLPKTPRSAALTALAIPTAAGILGASKKARQAVSSFFNPVNRFEAGKKLGSKLETNSAPSNLLPLGLAAGGLSGLALGGLLTTGISKIKSSKETLLTTSSLQASIPTPVGAIPTEPVRPEIPKEPKQLKKEKPLNIKVSPKINNVIQAVFSR